MEGRQLIAIDPKLVGTIRLEGLKAYCTGYALDKESRLVYLSLVGFKAAVRAVWAAVMQGRWVEVGPVFFHRLPGDYLRLVSRLPEEGADHLVILHHQATHKRLEPGQTFYLLHHDYAPPLEAFVAYLDRATRAPLLPEWAAWLWEQGLAEGLIEALPDAKGTHAWKVDPTDEAWLRLIGEGMRNGSLHAELSGSRPLSGRRAPIGC